MPARAYSAPGPFTVADIREESNYELVNGHRIECQPSGRRHGVLNLDGGAVLRSDPAVEGHVGVDVGIRFDDKNMRAPDVVVGIDEIRPGFQTTIPALVVEYADTGQDEVDLTDKITKFLAAGTRYFWVVRLVGLIHVEAYTPDQPMRKYSLDDELRAPGVLKNPVPVRALVDRQAANTIVLRNLLQQQGYEDIDKILAQGFKSGWDAGLEKAREEAVELLLTVLKARGLVPDDNQIAVIRRSDRSTLARCLLRVAIAASVAEVIASG